MNIILFPENYAQAEKSAAYCGLTVDEYIEAYVSTGVNPVDVMDRFWEYPDLTWLYDMMQGKLWRKEFGDD